MEYVFNFLDTTGHRKFNLWKPAGATPDGCVTDKNSTEGFLDHMPQTWTTMSCNGTGSPSLKTSVSVLGKPLMSWLTPYMPLMTNATSQLMRRNNDMSNSGFIMH